ncbi:MAG: ABC transporter permease [Dethiobacter sp.]|jgi:ABC-type antimicrobial peptide transport system permease subunit|nr:ABC transporter permease [Dethiobacter sp.]
MKLYDLLVMANRNLWRRKGRTMLTILGLSIGTVSVIVLFSLGIGLAEWQRVSMEQWGSLNIITVNQAFFYPGMPEEEMESLRLLNEQAVSEIEAMPGVLGVAPAFTVGGEARKGRDMGYLHVVGIEPGKMELMEFEVQAGRLLLNEDRYNVVAGSHVINNFIQHGVSGPAVGIGSPSEKDPLELLDRRLVLTLQNAQGQKRGYILNVVGILGTQFAEHAHAVYAPLSLLREMHSFMNRGAQQTQVQLVDSVNMQRDQAGMQRIQRRERTELQYSFVSVRTKNVGYAKQLGEELRLMGYQAHSIADQLEGIEQGTRIVQAVLGGIGAISLLVATIGIINTMVMSIYERTREIAVIKVLGASFSDIRRLFLTEAALIGLLGGMLGLVCSFLLSLLINIYAGAAIGAGAMGPGTSPVQISVIPLWLTVFALAFSTTIGIIAGLYPATRAMRLDPVTAMRHY